MLSDEPREHKATERLPTDPFDKELLRLTQGLPNGAHAKPTTVQVRAFYGHTTQYIIQTVRTEDQGATVFITQVSAEGSHRYMLPQRVLDAIDRQRGSITTQLRRRHGRRLADERKAKGIEPGFMKGRQQPKRKKGRE